MPHWHNSFACTPYNMCAGNTAHDRGIFTGAAFVLAGLITLPVGIAMWSKNAHVLAAIDAAFDATTDFAVVPGGCNLLNLRAHYTHDRYISRNNYQCWDYYNYAFTVATDDERKSVFSTA